MKSIKYALIALIYCNQTIAMNVNETSDLQIAQESLFSLLITAIQEHNQDDVDLILKHTDENIINAIDQHGLTPLHYAVALENNLSKCNIVKSLIIAGANPDDEDAYGCSSYEIAVANKDFVTSNYDATNIQVKVVDDVLHYCDSVN